MADKIFRRRIIFCTGGQNIARRRRQPPKNVILPKVSQCRKCRTVPKMVKDGTFFDFQTCSLLQNNKKTQTGDPLGTLKIFEKSHSAEKIKRDPLASAGFVGYVKKVKKKRKGEPFGDKKIFEKNVAQCRKKIRKGDSLVPSGSVGYLEKVKNERGDPLH